MEHIVIKNLNENRRILVFFTHLITKDFLNQCENRTCKWQLYSKDPNEEQALLNSDREFLPDLNLLVLRIITAFSLVNDRSFSTAIAPPDPLVDPSEN